VRVLSALAALMVAASLAACSSSSGSPSPSTSPSAAAQRAQAITHNEGEARALVELFGARQQNVTTQAPAANARNIRVQYGGLVAPALLARWMSKPTAAPGRNVSSPWPDHIAITAVVFNGSNSCSVSGQLVMLSSAYVANGAIDAEVPVHLQLSRLSGKWLITDYVQGP